MTKIGMKRLWQLVERMKLLPASANKHFAMQDFIVHNGDAHQHKIPRKPTVKDLHACGTTACALGWAMTVPHFRRAGLRIQIDPPWFEGQLPWYSVVGTEKVFGLDDYENEAEWDLLFGGDNKDRTPKLWAKRVSKLLRKWERA